MRLLVQRVKKAKITVEDKLIASIKAGLLVYLGIHKNDSQNLIQPIVHKLINLRVFEDSQGKMNLSAINLQKEIMIVSQFTLYGNAQKGFRPNFMEAMAPEQALKLYKAFLIELRKTPLKVEEGRFGAMMQVSYTNDGPISIIIDKDN